MGCGASAHAEESAQQNGSSGGVGSSSSNGADEVDEATGKRKIEPVGRKKRKLMSRRRSNSVIRITDYTGEGKRGNRQRSSVVEGNTRIEPLGPLGEGKVNMTGTEFHQHAVAGSAW